MTADDLQALLDAHDAEGCIALFANATEAERRKVAKLAEARLRAVTAGIPPQALSILDTWTDESLRKWYPWASLNRDEWRAAQVAVLATASLGALKKLGERCLPPIDDALAVLSARRPPWVGDWAEAMLSWGRRTNPGQNWPYVRRLIRAGLCERLRSPQYLRGMILAISWGGTRGSIREALRSDPELLDNEVWEILEGESMLGEEGLFPADPSAPDHLRWEVVFAQFANEGRLSRARLLEACLCGLERDGDELQARWFALMHDTLNLTLEERVERADRYLALLASHNPPTVVFALKTLATLEKEGYVEPGSLIAAIGPVLLARAKATVLSALAFIDRAARAEPALRVRAAVMAVEALAHESPAVHEAVLDLVERHGEPTDPALSEALRARIEIVAASQRGRLASWLGTGVTVEEPETTAVGLDDLLARAAALDVQVAERAGVTAAVAVLNQGGGEVPAVELSEMEVPRLDPERAIVPVADLDELIEVYSAVLENPENPDELERVLDGVSRLCDRIPDDFAARTGPLRARVGHTERIRGHLVEPLGNLALAWINGQPRSIRAAKLRGHLAGVSARRILAIAQRAAERQAAPLLSAPTHLGGWIDPRVLVERVQLWGSLPYRSDREDASIALLRLAPDPGPRAEALRAAARFEGPYAAALRHALGGAGETVGPDPRIWVAAARARSPREDDPLVEARHPGLGPDAGQAARCSLRQGPHQFSDWLSRANLSLIIREPALPHSFEYDLPTVLLHDSLARGAIPDTQWLASLWPLGHESCCAAAIEWLMGLECTPHEARSYRPLLELLLDPDVPLGPMARLLLAGMLSANTVEMRGLAVDVLIAAVDDGRLDGRLLGESIDRLLGEGLIKPIRLAKALGDAARVSMLHSRVAAQALQLALIGLSPPPRDLHVLLELLKELLAETGERVSAPAMENYLHSLKVSGKAARLVRDLLAFTAGSNAASRVSAAARALTGRIERAERWARIYDSHSHCRGETIASTP